MSKFILKTLFVCEFIKIKFFPIQLKAHITLFSYGLSLLHH